MKEERAVWAADKPDSKKRYELRKQEERESRRALADFRKHLKEEEEDDLGDHPRWAEG